jgi:hypothetical protein
MAAACAFHLALAPDLLHAPRIPLFDVLMRHPGIPLTGRTRGMPQEFLAGDGLGAVLQSAGGRRVA